MFDFLSYIPLIGNTLTFLVPFLIVLSIVIFIHEFGHYIVGRWCGIHAEAFSMGFGPVLKSWRDKRGTRWQIAALPFGGYVKFLGDANGASAGVDQDTIDALPEDMKGKTFEGASLWRRAATVFAGPGINFLASFVIFSFLVLSTGVQTNAPVVGEVYQLHGIENQLKTGDVVKSVDGAVLNDRSDLEKLIDVDQHSALSTYVVARDGVEMDVTGPFPWLPAVGSVVAASPAARAGVKPGDLILKVGDQDVYNFRDLQGVILAATEDRVDMLVQRGAEQIVLPIRPLKSAYIKEDGSFGERVQIGVSARVAFGPEIVSVGFVEALSISSRQMVLILDNFVQTITKLIAGEISPKNLNGPLGIAVASGDTASQGWTEFIGFIAFVSTAIGLMNLLPIPILDGGHLVIFAYQAVFKRKPNEQVLSAVMLLGFAFLITLVLYATFYDSVRLAG